MSQKKADFSRFGLRTPEVIKMRCPVSQKKANLRRLSQKKADLRRFEMYFRCPRKRLILVALGYGHRKWLRCGVRCPRKKPILDALRCTLRRFEMYFRCPRKGLILVALGYGHRNNFRCPRKKPILKKKSKTKIPRFPKNAKFDRERRSLRAFLRGGYKKNKNKKYLILQFFLIYI